MRIDKGKLLISIAKSEKTITKLCEEAGVNRVTFYRIMNEKQKPMPATIGKLCRALDVQVEEIVKSE